MTMIARIYVRVARRPNYISGDRYKVDAGHKQDQRPLTQGDHVLKTLHFAVDVTVPDELFKDPMIPVVKIEVQSDGTFRDEPVVVQAPLEAPAVTELATGWVEEIPHG